MTSAQAIQQAVIEHSSSALFSIEKPMIYRRGKVRDIFLKDDLLYMVNTDRVSAFDHVLGTIPLKGALLCEQAEFWFKESFDIIKNHFIDRPDPQILVCKKAAALPVEVIVRGYLAGSLMREDPRTRGNAYGLVLDPSIKNYAPFNQPIITPTTKAALGAHDEPISKDAIISSQLVSKKHWEAIEECALLLFSSCAEKARAKGLLLVDTKYEFGLIDDELYLIDEIHTSDSSRFFIETDYHEKLQNGLVPTMLDKEFLRQELIKNHIDPKTFDVSGMKLDEDLRKEVAIRYFTLTEKITGRDFIPPQIGANKRVHDKLLELIC